MLRPLIYNLAQKLVQTGLFVVVDPTADLLLVMNDRDTCYVHFLLGQNLKYVVIEKKPTLFSRGFPEVLKMDAQAILENILRSFPTANATSGLLSGQPLMAEVVFDALAIPLLHFGKKLCPASILRQLIEARRISSAYVIFVYLKHDEIVVSGQSVRTFPLADPHSLHNVLDSLYASERNICAFEVST